jgi:glycosyltransferase involved in cell wall biosynthesis
MPEAKPRMNVLFTTVSLDLERGAGTAERTRLLATHLAARGCTCSIIAMNGQTWAREFEQAGIDVWTTGSVGRRFPIPTANLRRLWSMIRTADAVHVMGYWNILSVLASSGARLAGKPYLLCPAGEFASLDALRPVRRWFHRLLGRPMIAHASSLIAITDLERAETEVRLGGATPAIVVIPNGINAPPATPEQSSPPPALPARAYILFMGRLAPIKGPDLLLQAYARVASRFPDVDLVFAGPDGGMGQQLRNDAAGLDVAARVHFLGFVDEWQRLLAYRGAALLAVPSRSEAMSLVALEAAACGTMVLLTDRCGFDAIADAGGMVVRAEVDAITYGLQTLLSRPEQLVLNGARLRDFVLDRYAWSATVDRLLEHLSAVTGRPAVANGDRMAGPAPTKAVRP